MKFEEIVDEVFGDERSFNIPALYIVQILMILENLGLLNEEK